MLRRVENVLEALQLERLADSRRTGSEQDRQD